MTDRPPPHNRSAGVPSQSMEDPAQPAAEFTTSPPHLPLSRVRSTLLVASYKMVKTIGREEDYLRALPLEHRATITGAVAGTWLEIAPAMAHYRACDSLGLTPDAQVDIGRTVGAQIRGTLFGTIVNLSKEAGVTPWAVLPAVPRWWPRVFEGSYISIWKLGPKDSRLDVSGLPFVDVPYFFNALRGQIMGMLDLFCTRTYVNARGHFGPGAASMRIQWA